MLGKSDEIKAKFILDTFDRVKVGGILFIPKNTYETKSNGRFGAESLVKTLDIKIELPLHQLPKMLIASKR